MNGTESAFAGWLLRSAVGGGLLLLLAWLLARLCHQPAWRQRLGESALLAALLLCALNLGPSWITLPLPCCASSSLPVPRAATLSPHLSPALLAESPPFEDTPAPFAVPMVNARLAGIEPIWGDASQPVALSESHAQDSVAGIASWLPSISLSQWLAFIILAYAAASVCLLLRWLLGHFVLWRLLRGARPAPEALNQVFETMIRRQKRRPRLLVSRHLSVPLSCGLIKPCVVVPASLCEPNAMRTLRWVFAHELSHTGRGDAWACLLFGLGQALYFCFPWFWWLRRQVRLCQEYIADAAAAAQEPDPEDYAQFLVSLTQAPALPLGALGVFGNSSDLLRRVTMLLQNPIHVEPRCPRWWSLVTAGSLLGLALVVSGVRLRADDGTAPADQEPRPAAVDKTEIPQAPRQSKQMEPAESPSLPTREVKKPKPAGKQLRLPARSMPWPVALEWLASQSESGISASIKQ